MGMKGRYSNETCIWYIYAWRYYGSRGCNTEAYEIANDEQLAQDLLKYDNDEDYDLDTNSDFEDYCYGSEIDVLNSDIDAEFEVDNDFDDYDGEIFDMVDGLI